MSSLHCFTFHCEKSLQSLDGELLEENAGIFHYVLTYGWVKHCHLLGVTEFITFNAHLKIMKCCITYLM